MSKSIWNKYARERRLCASLNEIIDSAICSLTKSGFSVINGNGEKLVDPYESSDYNSRTIGIYYQKGIEIVEVFKSKAPSNYYFHSLMWSPDGEHIVALDSEDNLLVFSKNKKINASKIVFDQEIDIDGGEYRSILHNKTFKSVWGEPQGETVKTAVMSK